MMGMCTCASNIKYIMVALLKNHTIARPFGIHEVRTGYTAIGKETRWRCSLFTTEDIGLTGTFQPLLTDTHVHKPGVNRAS